MALFDVKFSKLTRAQTVKILHATRLNEAEMFLSHQEEDFLFVGAGRQIVLIKRKRDNLPGFVYRLCGRITVHTCQ